MLRRNLWSSLSHILSINLPIMLIGDFNIVKTDEEKLGGGPILRAAKQDFVQFIDTNSLYDVPFTGSRFTWHRNRNGSLL